MRSSDGTLPAKTEVQPIGMAGLRSASSGQLERRWSTIFVRTLPGFMWSTPARPTTSLSSCPAGTSIRRTPTPRPGRFCTITSPLRSVIVPRGATIFTERKRLSLACTTNCCPLRICRNHRRKRMMAKRITAMPTMMATLRATDGSWMMGLSRRPVRIGRLRRPWSLSGPSSTQIASPAQPEAHAQVQGRRQQRVEDQRWDEDAAEEEAERYLACEQELGHSQKQVRQQRGGKGADLS